MFILLKRDWYGFRKHFFTYFVIWSLIPLLIHILLVIPLSQLIVLPVRYLNWAAAGIWTVSVAMASFFEASDRIRKLKYDTNQINIILHSPVSNMELLIALLLRGSAFGIIQFIFSIIITCTLNNEHLGLWNFSLIFIQIISIILLFSALGILIGLLISSRALFINIYVVFIMIVTLGIGTFIPIEYYPQSYLQIVSNIPLMLIIQNMQSIIINQNIGWISLFSNLICTLALLLTSLIISNKLFRKI